MLNNVTLMGRLTADPELRTTNTETPVTSFTLAVERDYKSNGEKETDFIDVVAWRHTAEFVCRYFTKGRLVAVAGSIQTRKYADRDGNNRKAVEIVANGVYFADSKRDNDHPKAGNSDEAAENAGSSDGFNPFAEESSGSDDLPF